jgi:hypothetical protein
MHRPPKPLRRTFFPGKMFSGKVYIAVVALRQPVFPVPSRKMRVRNRQKNVRKIINFLDIHYRLPYPHAIRRIYGFRSISNLYHSPDTRHAFHPEPREMWYGISMTPEEMKEEITIKFNNVKMVLNAITILHKDVEGIEASIK